MTTKSNIYDIDGEILREVGDNSELGIEKAQERLKMYQEKVKELDEKDPKLSVYNTYIKNLQRYVFNYYLAHPDILHSMYSTTEDEVKEALNEVGDNIDTQKEVVMDEYVPFEESTPEEAHE